MRILLIPSAVLIPAEMRSQIGAIPACLFPLQNVTMLERICDLYSETVDAVYVVIGKAKEKVREYVALKKLNVRLVEIDELHDLGYTVLQGMETILTENSNVKYVYINFGDTLLSNKPELAKLDIVYYSKETVSDEWTYFKYDDGVICSVRDKGQSLEDYEKYENVFPGVFGISQPQSWFEKLKQAQAVPCNKIDSFYQALMAYSCCYGFKFIPAQDWFDVGHKDRYAHAKTMVASRAFNTIEIDKERGLLTKRSENHEKLIDEIKWYLRLPDQLQYLLPRIYHYSINGSDPYVTMEYYGYTTLHEMLVYGNVKEEQWRKIFARLLFILKDMKRFQVHDSVEKMADALKSMYIDKTISRLEKLRTDKNFVSFFTQVITVNGKKYPSLDTCMALLRGLVHKRLVKRLPRFCIIHGDLCFSNILVENDFGFIRTIDPRGSFGDYDIYGDQRYEIAKLMHSIDGQYDLLIEDMFSVTVKGTDIRFVIPQKAKQIYSVFRDVFAEYMAEEKDLKLIESLLFLSMIPLHSDALDRQYAMLATGLGLLEEAMGDDQHV